MTNLCRAVVNATNVINLSIVVHYQIEAQVTNHLSETTLSMRVHNDDECPTDTTFTFQLPKMSFLSEMVLTEETSNCTFTANFLSAKQAQTSFDDAITVIVIPAQSENSNDCTFA